MSAALLTNIVWSGRRHRMSCVTSLSSVITVYLSRHCKSNSRTLVPVHTVTPTQHHGGWK